jgi:hypothetical protein
LPQKVPFPCLFSDSALCFYNNILYPLSPTQLYGPNYMTKKKKPKTSKEKEIYSINHDLSLKKDYSKKKIIQYTNLVTNKTKVPYRT